MANPNPKIENLKPRTTDGKFRNLCRKTVAVRLTPELDEYVRQKTSRNQWLIEAIFEKYERETKETEKTT